MRHMHEHYRFGIIESGQWRSFYRGVSHTVGPKQLQVAQPGETSRCEFQSGESYTFRVVSVPAHLVREAWAIEAGPADILLADHILTDPPLAAAFSGIHQALMQPGTALETSARLQTLLQLLQTRLDTRGIEAPRWLDAPSSLKLARDFLASHPERNVTLKELSDFSQLSSFHFSRLFRRHFGLPPHAFQNHCRVQRAKTLLAGGIPSSGIATELGFADQSHFIRTFGRHAGMTPEDYRKGLLAR